MSRRKPIYSVHEEDPDLQEPIHEFVVGLAERIDGLQDLHSLDDFARLAELCALLSDEAQRLGYPILATVARSAAEAAGESKRESSEQALVEITEITQRIRQAHRGAA